MVADRVWSAFRVGCHACDLLVDIPALAPGERAYCPRCGHHITSHIPDQFQRGLALSIASLVFMAIAMNFPFLSFERAGIANSMTLPQTSFALYREGAVVLALLVAGFILLIPALMLAIQCTLCVAVLTETDSRALRPLGRLVTGLVPWSFVEVFIIGVIVSLVKLTKMADVSLGASFWAYVGFAFTFVGAFASLDRHALWAAIAERTR